jgi:hypothetical protein
MIRRTFVAEDEVETAALYLSSSLRCEIALFSSGL